MITFRDEMICQRIHTHGNTEIFHVVKKLTKREELVERYAFGILDAVQEPVEVHVILVGIEVCIPKQNFGEIHLGYGRQPPRKFIKLQFRHFGLQVQHELVEVFVVQLIFSVEAEEVDD